MTKPSKNDQSYQPLVYNIILTWNKREVTINCLQNLRHLTYTNFHTIIVDNGSNDDTVSSVTKAFPEVTVLINPKNLGFAGGANVGIRFALNQGADYVFLLNNDTITPPNILEILLSQAQLCQDTGIVMPKITVADQSQEIWFAGSQRHWLTIDSAHFTSHGLQGKTAEYTHKVDFIYGTAMLVNKIVFEKIGLFDEAFFLYYEDMDFCQRARDVGIELLIVPQVRVQHQISTSTDSLLEMRYYHIARSSVLFYKKHTKGIRWLVIIPYRIASAIRTTTRLLRQRQSKEIGAYFRGLMDGIKTEI